jgi:hypothetical protein
MNCDVKETIVLFQVRLTSEVSQKIKNKKLFGTALVFSSDLEPCPVIYFESQLFFTVAGLF